MKQDCKTLQKIIEKEKNNINKGIIFIDQNGKESFVCYHDIYLNAKKLLCRLQYKGVKAGTQVILQLSKEEDLIIAIWACLLGNIIVVPMTIADKEEERLRVLNVYSKLEEPYIVTTSKLERENFIELEDFAQKPTSEFLDKTIYIDGVEKEEVLDAVITKADESDSAFIMFTSGSTGQPKGVKLTHHNMVSAIEDRVNCFQQGKDESIILNWMPATHMMGLITSFVPVYSCDNYYMMSMELFETNPIAWMEKADEHRANVINASNFSVKFFMAAYETSKNEYDWDLSCIRSMGCGAEPISKDVIESFLNAMDKFKFDRTSFCPNYGMTEGTALITSNKIGEDYNWYCVDRSHLGFGDKIKEVKTNDKNAAVLVGVGERIATSQVRVCDKDDQIVEDGIVGRVEFQGESMTPGYYRNDEATKQAHAKDGWFITGDLGFMMAGDVVITGREKDMLIVNGQNYYAIDIERVAMQLAEVENAVVFGVEERTTGKEQVILCVLYKKEQHEFHNVISFIHKYVQKKIGLSLSAIIPVNEIPVAKSGKVQRIKLKEYYVKNQAQLSEWLCANSEKEVPQNELEEKIAKVWCDILQISQIGTTDDFYAIGGNSLHMNFIVARLRDENIYISMNYFINHPTIRELALNALGNHNRKESEDNPMGDVVVLANRELLNVRDGKNDVNHWNIGVLLEVLPVPDKDKMEKTVRFILDYHDGLRLRYHKAGNWWKQSIGKTEEELPITYFDFSDVSEKEQIEKMEQKIDLIQNHISLEERPVRFAVFSFGKNKPGRIYLIAHHAILDGYGITLFRDDFIAVFGQVMDGKEPVLPKKTTSLRKWSKCLYDYAQKKEVRAELNDWLTPERGVYSIPLDYPEEAERNYFKYETILEKQLLTKKDTDLLFYSILNQSVSINDIIVTALIRGVERWTGHNEALLDYTFNGRYPLEDGIDLSRTIGWIAFLAPVYLGFPAHADIIDVFEYVRKRIHSIPNGGLGYGCLRQLCNNAEIHEKMSRIPYPEIMYNYVKFDFGEAGIADAKWGYIKEAKEWAGQNEGDNITRGRLIDFVCANKEGHLCCKIQYSRNLHKEETMERFFEYVKEELCMLISRLSCQK